MKVEVSSDIFSWELERKDEDVKHLVDLSNLDKEMELYIPQQLSEAQVAAVEQITQGSDSILKTFFASNIFLSLFSASALQSLWDLVNAMQMIVLTSLFRLDYPLNVSELFK